MSVKKSETLSASFHCLWWYHIRKYLNPSWTLNQLPADLSGEAADYGTADITGSRLTCCTTKSNPIFILKL